MFHMVTYRNDLVHCSPDPLDSEETLRVSDPDSNYKKDFHQIERPPPPNELRGNASGECEAPYQIW